MFRVKLILNLVQQNNYCYILVQIYSPVIKGYCTSSRINCDMAKSLASSGLLVSDLAIPELILEQVQYPYYYYYIFLILHF